MRPFQKNTAIFHKLTHKAMKESILCFCIDVLFEIIGSLCIAIAIHNFALSAGFPMTGFSGISIILNRFFFLPIGLSTLLLNIPLAFLCYHLIGRSFLLKTLRCMIISSFFLDKCF